MSATDPYLSRPWLAHYQKGVPASVEIAAKTVPQAFDEATERSPERTAVVFYGRSISYRELREATDRLACALARLGVKKGDRVALYLLNSPQFVIAYFAALKCGATVTPISPVYTSHEVRFQLEDSGARVVICQDILHEKVAKSGAALDAVIVTNVGEYLPALKRVFSKKAEVRGEVHWLQDLLKANPPEPPQVRRAVAQRRAPAGVVVGPGGAAVAVSARAAQALANSRRFEIRFIDTPLSAPGRGPSCSFRAEIRGALVRPRQAMRQVMYIHNKPI